MAGIGFELRRVVSQGGNLTKTVQALASGVFVVAGPWLLTILTIYVVGWVSAGSESGSPLLFTAIVTYTYAVSLVVFSPLQYFFTRLVSDLVWKEQFREASWYLCWVLLASCLSSGGAAWLVVGNLPLPAAFHPESLRWAWVAFAASVNGLWVVMLFISVLKWYGRILAIYLLGSAASALLMTVWEPLWGLAGMVGGLAAGNGIIVLGLFVLSLIRFAPRRPEAPVSLAWSILLRNGWLILCGVCYALGLWVDKFAFWIWRGEAVSGSTLLLYADYDAVVYLASLTVIPGLVYFVIVTETQFATRITEFLNALSNLPYRAIRRRQYDLAHSARREWIGLAGFQFLVLTGVFLIAFLANLPLNVVLGIGAVGSLLQLLLMAGLTFLFYLDLYQEAAAVAALFLGAGFAGSALQILIPGSPPGLGFLLANVVGLVGCRFILFRRIRSIDRILFNRW